MNAYVWPIVVGSLAGIITRLFMLKGDYRQYPTYLHGKIIHIAFDYNTIKQILQ